MTPDFIPLLPDLTQSSRITRAAGLPGGATSQDAGFAPLLPGDPLASPALAPSDPPPAHAHGRLPVVTLKRDGDRVTHIQVRCSCGEVVELDCAY